MTNATLTVTEELDPALDDFAAELTEVVYPIVLRQVRMANWLDLELELWRELRKTVEKWAQDWPQAGVMLVDALQEGRELS